MPQALLATDFSSEDDDLCGFANVEAIDVGTVVSKRGKKVDIMDIMELAEDLKYTKIITRPTGPEADNKELKEDLKNLKIITQPTEPKVDNKEPKKDLKNLKIKIPPQETGNEIQAKILSPKAVNSDHKRSGRIRDTLKPNIRIPSFSKRPREEQAIMADLNTITDSKSSSAINELSSPTADSPKSEPREFKKERSIIDWILATTSSDESETYSETETYSESE